MVKFCILVNYYVIFFCECLYLSQEERKSVMNTRLDEMLVSTIRTGLLSAKFHPIGFAGASVGTDLGGQKKIYILYKIF